ncbi:hypothetical protein [Streptomyces sp. enrichment culture]|uniref:hypothetical protein n=1 Tax=Streptomyces sp. enrichment culture TaxID=1795815 RepID=UPI003F57DA05
MPTRDHTIAEQSKNHRYSTNHQMVIDTDTRQAAAGRPLPGNRNDCQAWNQSGTEAAADDTTTITDSSHDGTRPATPHHRTLDRGRAQSHQANRQPDRRHPTHPKHRTCPAKSPSAPAAHHQPCPVAPTTWHWWCQTTATSMNTV